MTSEKIHDFAGKYKGSEEERRDVLNAYRKFRGDLNKLFKEVMLCNVLDDDDRFRGIIDEAIKRGDVEGYEAYVHEPEKRKQARRRQAERDAKEAEKHAKDLGLNGHKKEGKKVKKGGEDDLAAMIQQRQRGRAANFLDDLAAKYAAPKAKRGKKRPSAEPPEEAFQKVGARAKKQRKLVIEEENEDDEDDVDLEGDDLDDRDDVEVDEEQDKNGDLDEEQEDALPSKSRKGNVSKAARGKKQASRKKR